MSVTVTSKVGDADGVTAVRIHGRPAWVSSYAGDQLVCACDRYTVRGAPVPFGATVHDTRPGPVLLEGDNVSHG